MTQTKSNHYWKLGTAISLVIGGAISARNCTLAQSLPIPDGTLDTESSVVQPNVVIDGIPSEQIDGGGIRGANLFHSFQEFNVGEGQRVYFSNPAGVENILSRVTGGSRSEILGKLGVLGNADLFLINPSGIIFGPNASLDLKGSFIVSTANSLNFADGTQFRATANQTSPLLTVSGPIGLQFAGTAASISVQGTNLEVQPGKTLGLLGGDATLEGGRLTAPGGRIELGSVASSSLVRLNPTIKGWSLGYEGVQNFQNIRLTQGNFNGFASEVNASGEGGGDIQVQGKQVTLADGSQIRSINQGTETGGNLTVNASSVELVGTASALSSETIAAGDAGDITINTKRLLISDGAFVSTQSSLRQEDSGQITLATGRGGNLTVNASESVELKNGSAMLSLTLGSANAGDITINTRRLHVEDSLGVLADTLGEGQGGTLIVNASESVELSGGDNGLFSATQAAGDAGDLKIVTGNLIVRDGAEVNVSSQGTGDAGNLDVTAHSIRLENGGKLTATSASGRGGGNIRLQDLNLLLLRGNSAISTSAGGSGKGGNINIDTNLLVGLENSDITANAYEGEGGFIQIATKGIFGLEVREQLTENSDITAFSQKDPSLNGVVEINRPDIDPSAELVTLPVELVDVSGLIAQGCSANGGHIARGSSEFIATGRGGMPPTPSEALRSETALADLGKPVQGEANRASAATANNPTSSSPVPLVEAQGWVIGSKGEVLLTAQAPTVTPHIPWLTPTSCHGS